ncbi:MAG: 16S rRNA (adenine(1518)-N(6)/adenine(1519)-N(6))-dimethyltransferase [Cryomorphaceae bacterium]|nr:16S rRNA (adenine(1518)-N(6)/adenine(1519)-N(6))-dimethyltransferase [Cryomorphaceae bacterium]
MSVKPKKQLGQHFLKDAGTCQKIAKQVIWTDNTRKVLEIGPGMGALSKYLWEIPEIDLWLLDVDIESIDYLRLFKCLEHRNQVPQIMGMFQKEVAVRVAQKPGSKEYGIISVLLQTYYDIHYCFTVDEHVFIPPPKVKSGVIRCVRNERDALPCDEKLYFQVVKVAFNQRRKTLRNSLRVLLKDAPLPEKFEQQRPERLSVDDFIELTCFIETLINKD